jgi:hypothetical protein
MLVPGRKQRGEKVQGATRSSRSNKKQKEATNSNKKQREVR